ncbi:unnamed protein product [Urochloa decumbens]|uniref:Uncharacterized protein n=1 Tax=Urochloa decumbens TaxID=240449 RepID=A0ABC8ZR30_9POAL
MHLQFLFANQASSIQEAAKNYLDKASRTAATPNATPLTNLFNDYITKAAALADKLQLHDTQHDGTEAWSGAPRMGATAVAHERQPVPVADVFQRIWKTLPPVATGHADKGSRHATSALPQSSTTPTPLQGEAVTPPVTVKEVDDALRHLKLAGDAAEGYPDLLTGSPVLAPVGNRHTDFISLYRAARDATPNLNHEEAVVPQRAHPAMVTSLLDAFPESSPPAMAGTLDEDFINQYRAASDTTPVRGQDEPGEAVRWQQDQAAPASNAALLDALFVRPATPILQHQPVTEDMNKQSGDTLQQSTAPSPAPPKRRRQRVFDMSTEFLATFQGPVPEHIIAALTAAFNLDGEDGGELDAALAAIAGDAVDDLNVDAVAQQAPAVMAA